MKKVLVPFILLFLSITLIVSGFSLDFFYGYQEDKGESNTLSSAINYYYGIIQTDLEDIRLYMTSMNDFFDLYYDDALMKKDKYGSIMLEIDKLKNDIDFNYKSMSDICSKNVVQINKKKCDSMKDSYASFSTTYDLLLKTYNDFIEQCNNNI